MFSLAVLLGRFIVILVVLFAANASIRILRQYERGVMFTLGCFSSVRGPGPVFLVPYVQRVVRVDLRTVVMEIPSQDLITRDNVSVKVDAVERTLPLGTHALMRPSSRPSAASGWPEYHDAAFAAARQC